MSQLTLRMRALGRRQPLVPDWQVPVDDEDRGGDPLTLRQLITRVVRHEVQSFRARQDARKVVRLLSSKEMEAGLVRGKVDSGGRELFQAVDEETAVASALRAFEDGLYLVILDGIEQRELDQEVHLLPESELKFIRLVMLAGV